MRGWLSLLGLLRSFFLPTDNADLRCGLFPHSGVERVVRLAVFGTVLASIMMLAQRGETLIAVIEAVASCVLVAEEISSLVLTAWSRATRFLGLGLLPPTGN